MDLLNKNIFELLSVDPETQIISFLDRRITIDDTLSGGLLRKELIQVFGEYGAKNVLTRYGYAQGWRTAQMLKETSPDLFHGSHGGAHLHMLYGHVFTTSLIQSDGLNGKPLIQSKLEHSYEAEQHVIHFGLSKESICWTLTGFASGYETFKNDREVYFVETKCKGKGDPYCEIEGRFREEWSKETLQEMLPFYGMASTNDLLSELTNRIHNTEKKLKDTKNELATIQHQKKCSKEFVVRSKGMQDILHLAHRAARVNTSILITGDSGVGKEVLARYIHDNSPRCNSPFIAVNCGAFTETLLETELFGHKKGAFTGADRDHKGLFEEAEGGTVFLDEIGETSLSMQIKLLRVIQEREIKRVGENTTRKINVRIISATNRDLEQEAENGNFRKDLFYRLNVITLKIPNLSERTADILPLAHCFLKHASDEMNNDVTGISPSAAKILLGYTWPGNVRELQNTIHRAVALCENHMIGDDDLPPEIKSGYKISLKSLTLKDIEREHIRKILSINDGDKTKTAKDLEIGIATLYRKINEYNL